MHCITSCNYLTLLKVESVDMTFSCLLFVCCLFVVGLLFVCCLFVCLLFVCCLFVVCLQANCYSMALTALSLTDPKYAWVVRPVEVEEVCVGVWCVRRGRGGGNSWVVRPVEVEEVCVGRSLWMTRGGEGVGGGEVRSWQLQRNLS